MKVSKKPKKVKVFNDLHLEPLKTHTKEVEVLTFHSNNSPSEKQYAINPPAGLGKDTLKSLEVMGVDVVDDKDSIIKKRSHTTNYIRENVLHVPSSDIVKHVKGYNEMYDYVMWHSYVIPNVPRLENLESKKNYINNLVTEKHPNPRAHTRISTMLFYAQNGYSVSLLKILADTNDTNTFAPSGYLDKISAGKIEEISLNAAWFNILNEFILNSDNTTLEDSLDDDTFVEKVKKHYSNLTYESNEHTASLAEAIFNRDSPLCVKDLKTIKARDAMKSLSVKALKNYIEIFKDKYKKKKSDANKDFISTVLIPLVNIDRNPSKAVEIWVKRLEEKGVKKEDIITSSNLAEYLSIAYVNNIVKANSVYNSDSSGKHKGLLQKTLSLNTSKLASELSYERSKILIITDILNLLGTEFVTKEMKLSHLHVLIASFVRLETPLLGRDGVWRKSFLLKALELGEDTVKGKEKALQYYFEANTQFVKIGISVSALEKENIFDGGDDVPLDLVLSIFGEEVVTVQEARYPNITPSVETAIELNKQGF